ncbi:hypothetical protein PCANC_00813 [Puccinia coronata f. sp. avenae]|uniref:Uncharacterized protein n=1 Tax=Puccinia coronata f. sp. avenae TaxID=200324 RepID=A0A2N5W7J0_9BASI|nr:hypothetical protein PCANC_00813 [Puccinia coronata f. sp. avenae]
MHPPTHRTLASARAFPMGKVGVLHFPRGREKVRLQSHSTSSPPPLLSPRQHRSGLEKMYLVKLDGCPLFHMWHWVQPNEPQVADQAVDTAGGTKQACLAGTGGPMASRLQQVRMASRPKKCSSPDRIELSTSR